MRVLSSIKFYSTITLALLFLLFFTLFYLFTRYQKASAEQGDDPRGRCENCLNLVDKNYQDKSSDERYPLYLNLCTQKSNSDYGYNSCEATNDAGKLLILGQGWIDIHKAKSDGIEASKIQQMECDSCVELCNYGPWNPAGQARDECMNGCRNDTAKNGALCLRDTSGKPVTPPPPADAPTTVTTLLALNPFTVFKPVRGGFGFDNHNGKNDINNYVQDVMLIGSVLFGILAMIKIVFGGLMYATAAGNAQRIADAKSHILYALLGLGLIATANLILSILGASPLKL